MEKNGKLNIINGNVHIGLMKSLAIAMHAEKWQIFTKDFVNEWVEWVEYPFLMECAIAKKNSAKENIFLPINRCEQTTKACSH